MALTIDPVVHAELARFGFDAEQLERFAARLASGTGAGAGAGAETNHVRGVIEAIADDDLRVLPAPGTAERVRLHELGARVIAAGEVGVVVLAGGMATRFGGVVKAAVPVIDGRSFLDLKLADARGLGARLGVEIPAYVMTSYATHDRVRAQIADEQLDGAGVRVECFAQLVSVRLRPDGTLFTDAAGAVSPYATGHGDLTFALRASGVLGRFRAGGGRLLYVSNVDNLGATLDPAVIGAHVDRGGQVTCEVVRKGPGDRGGAPARVDGVPQIVEAFRFPPGFDQDAIPQFNVNSFVLDAAAIDRDFDLTWFRVEKQVDGRPAVQFERLVGQVTAFLPTRFLEVPRGGADGRFQPVKDPEELAARLADIETILGARGVLAR
jgi:UTP--glucose-1-phosphate uridylyltransferase